MRPGDRAVFSAAILAVFAGGVSSAEAARLAVACKQPELVAGKQLWVVRVQEPSGAAVRPIHHFPGLILLKDKHQFGEGGVCTLDLEAGVYRFHVLWQKDGTLVALSSGDRKVTGDTAVELKALAPLQPKCTHAGVPLPLTQLQVRVRGIPLPAEEKRGFWEHEDRRTMVREVWRGEKQPGETAPKLILSPGQAVPICLTARKGRTHAVLWHEFRPEEPNLELERLDLRDIRFQWGGDETSFKRIADPEWTLYPPDLDDFVIPLHDDTRLLTNRHWLEASYGYRTKSGEKLHFARRARLFPKGENTVRWGGELKVGAYARVLMQWAAPGEAIIWGAYLHNAQNDVLNTFDPKDREPNNDTPLSAIRWQATLIRTDGKALPPGKFKETRLGSIPVTKGYVADEIGDIDVLEQKFAIAVSYEMDGKPVSVKVAPAPFVTWRSARVSLEGPREWEGQAHNYLDKSERILDYCIQKELVGGLEHLQLFWTNNWGAGWTNTTRPARHKRMQMSFEDFRRRQSLFDLPDIFVHEVTHAYGYEHGSVQDRTIRLIETVYLYHRHALADHPEYEPSPVRVIEEIESARNRGDDSFGKHKKINVERK